MSIELGQQFHDDLHAIIAEESHPDDIEHDDAVGASIAMLLETGDPVSATKSYNEWAKVNQYEPVDYLGTFTKPNGDKFTVMDIKTAVVMIENATGRVRRVSEIAGGSCLLS